MKSKNILFTALFLIGSISYANTSLSLHEEIANEVNSIEAEYQELLQREFEKKEEFRAEKEKLEDEIVSLKEKAIGKEELYVKLKKDSEIRWHRDQYKKLLKKYDVYYDKLEKTIAEKEQQIIELSNLLEILK